MWELSSRKHSLSLQLPEGTVSGILLYESLIIVAHINALFCYDLDVLNFSFLFFFLNCLVFFFFKNGKWLETNEEELPTDIVTSFTINEDFAYSFASNGVCSIWNLTEVIQTKIMKPVFTISCHALPITAYFIHRDLLFTGSSDNCIKSFRIKHWKVSVFFFLKNLIQT